MGWLRGGTATPPCSRFWRRLGRQTASRLRVVWPRTFQSSSLQGMAAMWRGIWRQRWPWSRQLQDYTYSVQTSWTGARCQSVQKLWMSAPLPLPARVSGEIRVVLFAISHSRVVMLDRMRHAEFDRVDKLGLYRFMFPSRCGGQCAQDHASIGYRTRSHTELLVCICCLALPPRPDRQESSVQR